MPRGPSTISRVEFFCDDKRVGEALRSLVNIAIGAPSVQPVTNATKKGNGLAAVSGGKALDQFAEYLAREKPPEITAPLVKEWMTGIGMSAASISYLLRNAMKAKLIKKHPKALKTGPAASRYLVIPQRKPASK